MNTLTKETIASAISALNYRIGKNRASLGDLRPHQQGIAHLICQEIESDERAVQALSTAKKP